MQVSGTCANFRANYKKPCSSLTSQSHETSLLHPLGIDSCHFGSFPDRARRVSRKRHIRATVQVSRVSGYPHQVPLKNGMLTGIRTSNIMMAVTRDGLGRKTGMAMNKFNSTGGLMSSDNRKYTGNGHIVSKNVLVMSRFPRGFFDSAGSPYYYLTDFQGNNIGVYDKTGKLVQRTDYYASGEPWLEPVYGSGAAANRYLFGGKERMAGGALNEYDFEARNYVASFQRFTTIDPEAEKFPWMSPYAYCNANPVNFIDPFGLYNKP